MKHIAAIAFLAIAATAQAWVVLPSGEWAGSWPRRLRTDFGVVDPAPESAWLAAGGRIPSEAEVEVHEAAQAQAASEAQAAAVAARAQEKATKAALKAEVKGAKNDKAKLDAILKWIEAQ